ncbi:SDR family NAD(P)-dependent oxidoreductase [Streptomyces sp. GMR22]|nr:SDR family NAD(P)-dependent oxidoreductase [Streptomyces sp. GMR22]
MLITKIALVSGANKGIGYAIAQGLGAIGFRVAVGARDEAGREEAVKHLCAEGADAFGVALALDVVRTVLDTNVLGVIRVTNAMLPLLGREPQAGPRKLVLERRTNLARRSKCATIEAWQREGAGHSGATRCSPGSRSSIPPSSCSIPAARGR